MVRRQWGSGSLSRRKSDGRWIGRVSDGKGGHRYVTGTDEKVVRRRLRDLARSTSSTPSRQPTRAYLDQWLVDVVLPHRAPRTYQTYESIVREHIAPAIGGIQLGRLTLTDVQRLVNGVLARRSSQTANNVLVVIRSALSHAVRAQLVPTNVAKLVQQPRVTHRVPEPFTLEEVRKLIDGTTDDPLHAVYVLAATTGMRQGEILALRDQDIDMEHGIIRVTATMRRIGPTTWAREPTKTVRSERTLWLPTAARGALSAHVRHSAVFTFTRANGHPWPAAEVTRRFQRACAKLGLRKVRFHDLRHSSAALMLDASGGDLRMVMSQMGHSTISTTVDLYGGRAEQARSRAAALMDGLLDLHDIQEG